MRRFLLSLLGAASSAALLVLALPPSNIWTLAPLCLVPFLYSSRGIGVLKTFVACLVFMGIFSGLVCSGAFYRIPQGSNDTGFTLVGTFIFTLVVVCVGLAQSEVTRQEGWSPFALACVGIAGEFITMLGLPAHLALATSRVPVFLLLASVGGIWLASYALWTCNLLIARWLAIGEFRLAGIFAASVVALCFIPPLPTLQGKTARVAAIQTMEIEHEPLAALNLTAAKDGAGLVVWPEFTGINLAPGGNTKEMRDLSAEAGQPAFITSFRDDAKPFPRNTAAIFDQGTESPRYYKRKLFGGETSMHKVGTDPMAATARGSWVGLNICFDSCYPAIIGDTARLHPNIIALPTIDPESRYAFVAAAHAAFTPYRAAEQGISIVRADGYAYSQLVDNRGIILVEAQPGFKGPLVGDLPAERRWTIYAHTGDLVLYLALAGATRFILNGLRKRYSKTRTEEMEPSSPIS